LKWYYPTDNAFQPKKNIATYDDPKQFQDRNSFRRPAAKTSERPNHNAFTEHLDPGDCYPIILKHKKNYKLESNFCK
jgi:hypothetical protein